jgi:hypothetical protein
VQSQQQLSDSPQPVAHLVVDPAGDAGVAEPGYLDFVSVDISVGPSPHTVDFTFALAEPLPDPIEVPAGYDALGWEFCLDRSGGDSDIVGYPFAASTSTPCEKIVMVTTEGGSPSDLNGALLDRLPLLHGGEPTETGIPVAIAENGTQVTASVPQRLVWQHAHGGSGFGFVLYSTSLTVPLGNDQFENLDQAPDSGWKDKGQAGWPPF